jgi:hypothetical protein
MTGQMPEKAPLQNVPIDTPPWPTRRLLAVQPVNSVPITTRNEGHSGVRTVRAVDNYEIERPGETVFLGARGGI